MANKQHDIAIIGGGSAGYAAARTAHDAGADVAVVDHGLLNVDRDRQMHRATPT